MAHEHIIRHGLIVENSYSFKDSGVVITGITNVGPITDSQYTIVTENVIKSTIDGLTIANLSGTTIVSPTTDDILIFSGGTWVNTPSSSISVDAYTKVESDNRFVNVTGDAMTGTLDTTVLNVSTSLDVTGNTTVNGDIIVTGTVDGIDINGLNTVVLDHTGDTSNPHSTTLANLTDTTLNTVVANDIIIYSGGTWVNTQLSSISEGYTKLESDARFINVDGDTMTGALVIDDTGGTALTVLGNTILTGDLFVSGTTTTINSSDLNVADNIITLNSGETGAGVTKLTSGIKIDRGTADPYYFVFDELSDTFRVGSSTATETPSIVTSGDTHAVAVREDNPIDSGITFWNDTHKRLDTNSNITIVGNDIVISGLVDGVDISTLKSDFDSHTGNTSNPHGTTLENLTDTTITGVAQDNVLFYSGGSWINVPASSISVDAYTKVESDARFVNVTGDTITGVLNISNNLNITGDTTVQGNIIVTGTVDGVDISTLASSFDIHTGDTTNPHDTSISNLTDTTITGVAQDNILVYSGGSWINTTLNSIGDNTFVNVDGDTMTGDLTITPLSGTSNRLVYVDSNGKLQESNEYVFKSNLGALGAGSSPVDTVDSTLAKGIVWHYVLDDGTNYRAGTVTSVWNGNTSGDTVEYSETSTLDIGNTDNVVFSVDIDVSGNARLIATIVSGTWSVSTSRFMIG